MITKAELAEVGLRPTHTNEIYYGKDGITAFCTKYVDAEGEFFRVELKQDPKPPDQKDQIWYICYTVEDLRFELAHMTYYASYTAARRGVLKDG